VWRVWGVVKVSSSFEYNVVYDLYLSIRALEPYFGKEDVDQKQVAVKQDQWRTLGYYQPGLKRPQRKVRLPAAEMEVEVQNESSIEQIVEE